MKKLLLLLLFLCASWANAAAPTLAGGIVVSSSASGTAPHCVFFDASAAADADLGNKAFMGLIGTWTFGDANAGAWTYGANAGQSKNFAFGLVAAHCYETAGTYTASLSISNGTTTIRPTAVTITVAAADTTWTGTATMCIANGTLPVAGSGGCPTGANVRQGTGDFDADIAACATGNTKRCLFKRGDSFTLDTNTDVGTLTDIYIGAYGSGAKPAIALSSTAFTFNNASSRWKFVDLAFTGTGNVLIFNQTAGTNTDIVVLRVDVLAAKFVGGTGEPDVDYVNMFFQDSTCSLYTGGNVSFWAATKSAMLGNNFGPMGGGTSEHVARIQLCQKCVVSSNTMTGPAASKHVLTLRAREFVDTGDDSYFVVIADNKFVAGDNPAWVTQIAPASSGQENHIYDVVYERNMVVAGAATTIALVMSASRVSVRNNIFDMSGGLEAVGVYLYNDNTGPTFPDPTDNQIVNNTLYTSASGSMQVIVADLDSGTAHVIVDTMVKNNLAQSPNSGTGNKDVLAESSGATGTVADQATGGNVTNAQITSVNVFASTPTTSSLTSYQPSSGSVAANGGIASGIPAANLDFFNCWDKTGANRIGAVAPLANRFCLPARVPIRLP